ncbi:MAG: hypothetical protein ACRD5M_02770 [Candidatus Acidiferrales bacterium]
MSEKTNDTAEAKPRRSILRSCLSALRIVALNFVIFAVLAEIFCLIYINVTNWPSSKPNYHVNYNSFWVDNNRAFGVWHRSNGHFEHKSGCYDVIYDTNSYGARDVERTLHSSKPRTVVLGDSFIEGMGLPAQDRLTNILEKDTGREYLNFGVGGNFGPLQYAILYKTMAAAFDHDQVVVGVLPDNDFHDMSLEYWKPRAPDRYRPYYADDFSIVYQGHFEPKAGEGLWDHVEAFLRAYLASYHVGQYIYSRFYWRNVSPYSGYNDYSPVDLARLKKALLDIKSTADAHHAKVAVFLIPRATDFMRLHQAGTNRLGPVMEQWGGEKGIPVKDLLPEMEAQSNGDYRSYFLTCDGHWSARGDAVAASILDPWLGEKKIAAN